MKRQNSAGVDKSTSRIDQEIMDLERKLGIKSTKDKKFMKDLEEDGLLDIFKITQEVDREYEQYKQGKSSKRVKETTNASEDDEDEDDDESDDEEGEYDEEEDEFDEENDEDADEDEEDDQEEGDEDEEDDQEEGDEDEDDNDENDNDTNKPSIDFSKVEFVLARLSPLKHIENLMKEFAQSNKSSQDKVVERLSKMYFADSSPVQKKHLLILLIIKGFIESKGANSQVHLFYRECGVQLKKAVNLHLSDYIAYAFIFKILNAQFTTSFGIWLLDQSEFKKFGAFLSLVGSTLRKESAKSILEISKRLDELSRDNNDYRYAQSIIKKIKLNQEIEVSHPENFTKYKTASKAYEKHKSEKLQFHCKVDDLIATDLGSQKWTDRFYQAPQENKLSSKYTELVQKYEQTLAKLFIEVLNQKLIACSIFEAENYLDAAERIFKLKVFRSHYNDIPHVIFILINSEDKFNPYYVYLSAQLITLINDLEFSFYKYIWNYFKSLMEDVDQKQMLFMVKFVAEAWKMNCLDFKVLKNLDFATIHKNQKTFNRLLFKNILKWLTPDYISGQIAKYLKSSKAALTADEIQTYAEKYKRVFFAKDFANEDEQETILEKLDLFENLV